RRPSRRPSPCPYTTLFRSSTRHPEAPDAPAARIPAPDGRAALRRSPRARRALRRAAGRAGARARPDRAAGGRSALGAASAQLRPDGRRDRCPGPPGHDPRGRRLGSRAARCGDRDRPAGVEEVDAELGLGLEVLRARAEDLHGRRSFEVVTARAVAALDKLARWTLPLVADGGSLLAMKGSSAADEIEKAQKALTRLGG